MHIPRHLPDRHPDRIHLCPGVITFTSFFAIFFSGTPSIYSLVFTLAIEFVGASIKTVAMLKKMGVRHIYAKAIDKLHESILEIFEINRILTPEHRAASDITHEMELGGHVENLKIDMNTYIMKFTAPSRLCGEKYDNLDLDKCGLKLIAVARQEESVNVMGIRHKIPQTIHINQDGLTVEDGDIITIMRPAKAFKAFYRRYTR